MWRFVSLRKPGAMWFGSCRWNGGGNIGAFGPPPEIVTPRWSGFLQPTPQFAEGHQIGTELRIADARGWPFVSMWAELDGNYFILGAPVLTSTPVRHGIRTALPPWYLYCSGHSHYPRVLPLRPIWPAFALNTLFYVMLLCLFLLLSRVPSVLRRLLRARRGLCPQCAYAIGESGVCTECGALVSRMSRRLTHTRSSCRAAAAWRAPNRSGGPPLRGGPFLAPCVR
jgi:hypothetical protein